MYQIHLWIKEVRPHQPTVQGIERFKHGKQEDTAICCAHAQDHQQEGPYLSEL